MNKQSIFQTLLLTVLAISAIALGWLCFDSKVTATEEDYVPLCATETPIVRTPAPCAASVPVETEAARDSKHEQVADHSTPFPMTHCLGTLTIGRKEISIAADVDEQTLATSPGWLPDSSLPGEDGMCVILGHRNRKHLRPLEKVEIGDEIFFTYPNEKVVVYRVSEITIFESTADWRLPSAEEDMLVLVTCYPFRYSGSAPGKYMVIAIAD